MAVPRSRVTIMVGLMVPPLSIVGVGLSTREVGLDIGVRVIEKGSGVGLAVSVGEGKTMIGGVGLGLGVIGRGVALEGGPPTGVEVNNAFVPSNARGRIRIGADAARLLISVE